MPTLHWWTGASSVSPYVVTIAWGIASDIIIHHWSIAYEVFIYCSSLTYFSVATVTITIKPKILLLDEAFSALDYQTRIMVTEDIYSILRKEKITALIVTHDISEAISMSDRVLVLSKRPGTIKDIHKIDFEMENRTPINCRQSPKFSRYFDCLWKELGVDEK